ncbi:hypothetical protein EMPS_05419 [Entomortierella parvispora]|uniref:Uncharacterized protein n=1 Tax=Entomortierella parvispora TaxID=205924 RepID=A0A9P3LWB4_9FUNG|nr:hypothetical protein EMPS_05419 [Entomortierella parvispora]
MSVSSDGSRIGGRKEEELLRIKYKDYKRRLVDAEKKTGQIIDHNQQLLQNNHNLEQRIASYDAQILHLEQMLESGRRPARTVTEHEHYENVLRFQRFEGIIRFLESSLYFVDPPENGDSSVEGRLRAVIEAMSKKEQKFQEIEAMNTKLQDDLKKHWSGGLEAETKGSGQKLDTESIQAAYKQEQDKNAKLKEEIDSLKATMDSRETSHQAAQKLQQSQLGSLKTSVEEYKVQVDNLNKELDRSEKGRRSVLTSKDRKIKELEEMTQRNQDLEKKIDDQKKDLSKTQKDLEKVQESYNVSKHHSLARDVVMIKKLTEELKVVKETLAEVRKENEGLLETKTQLKKLKEERNEDLGRLLELQEGISTREVQLSGYENKVNELQAALGRSEKEMNELTRKAKQEAQALSLRIESAETLAQERQSESEYLKETLAKMEFKLSEVSLQQLRNADARENDPVVEKQQRTIEQLQDEVRALQRAEKLLRNEMEESKEESKRLLMKTRERLRDLTPSTDSTLEDGKRASQNTKTDRLSVGPSPIPSSKRLSITPLPQSSDPKLLQLNTEVERLWAENLKLEQALKQLNKQHNSLLSSMQHQTDGANQAAEDEEKIRHDIQSTLSRAASLNETILAMEDEAKTLRTSREQMAERHKKLTEDLHRATEAKTHLEEKVERLERDLVRRTATLESKSKELVDYRTKAQEQQSRADSLEMELVALKKEVTALEKIKVEREHQLEGRDNALRQLNSARSTFEKVFQSKIDRLVEEKAMVERSAEAELAKILALHEQEMRKTVEECTASLMQAQRTQASTRLGMQGDIDLIKADRDRYKEKAEEAEQGIQKLLEDMEQMNTLLTGYIAVVREQEAGDMISEEKKELLERLKQRQEDSAKIEQLESDVQTLRETLDGQHEILSKYDQTMVMLTNRNENYLKQVQELEDTLSRERKAWESGKRGSSTPATTKPAEESHSKTDDGSPISL